MEIRDQAYCVICMAAFSSCTPYSLLGGSRTVGRHNFEVAAMVGMARDPFELTMGPEPITAEILGRFGVTERADLGLRVFTVGSAVEGRHQIYTADAEDSGPHISALVAANIGGRGGMVCSGGDKCTTDPVGFGNLLVVAGIEIFDRIDIQLGQRSLLEILGGRPRLSLGGDFAIGFRITRWLTIRPEITILASVIPLVVRERIHFGVGISVAP